MNLKETVAKIAKLQAPFTLLYVALIPFINWSYGAIPLVPMPDGGFWPPMSIVAGLVLVVRDFAQREIGHSIWGALAIAAILSFLTSSPNIAIASTCAFLISETVDWALFTFSKKPLSTRVMMSSLISAPIDTTLFWYLASLTQKGVFQPFTIATAILSKLLGAYIVYLMIRHREKKSET